MRILHTSDWHLGRGIHGHDLTEAQQVAVDHIIQTAISEAVDLLIIAGDVFDRQIPAVSDIKVLNDALLRIHAAGITTVITAGNHDSGTRLAAYSDLLTDRVHIVGNREFAGTGIQFADEHGPVVVYPLPYLDPDGARFELADDKASPLARSHEAVMSVAMERVRVDLERRKELDPRTRSVAVAHAFVVGSSSSAEEVDGARSDSERDLSVGGVQVVPASVFAGLDYVALGHLHGPRRVAGHGDGMPHIRYSGSILRYSLSEESHEKSFAIVDLGSAGVVTDEHVKTVNIPQPRGMKRLQGSMAELLADLNAQYHDHFVDITVIVGADEILDQNYYAHLDSRFSHILAHRVSRPGQADEHRIQQSGGLAPVDPMDNLISFFRVLKGGAEPTEKHKEIMRESLERVLKAGRD